MKFVKKLRQILKNAPSDLKKRLFFIAILLMGSNILVWILVLIASKTSPVLLGLASLAYGFGLRHAVDADHIAAIDNTTRKLMYDGKKPVAVGLFFSLGHSTIVIVLSLLIALSASFVNHNLPLFRETGSLIGTAISSFFLLAIGMINLFVLIDLLKIWRRVVKGGTYDDITLTDHLHNRGLLARIFKPVLKTVQNSWNMYLVGFLFGLGFDTASEVGLLSISAISGAKGMPLWYIILLPLTFTAGMALIDTIDGILMLGAYGWAYVKPIRKLYYNLNITLISVIIALFIGGVEAIQLISEKTGLSGGFINLVDKLSFDNLGYFIIGSFFISWFLSIVIYKLRGYDLLEKR